MKFVTYTPPAGNPDFPRFTSQYGYKFEDGKPVEVSSEAHLKKFEGNPYFKVSTTKPKPAEQKPGGGSGDGNSNPLT